MRRKTDKDVLKENLLIIISSILFLVFGLILPFTSSIDYDRLYEKDITIESIESIWVYRNGNRYIITTTDGEKYNITGDYNIAEVKDSLRNSTKAHIKYYEHRVLPFRYVEEIIVGEKYIVQYNHNDISIKHLIGYLSVVLALFGMVGFFYVKWRVKTNRALQNKREQRIIKKYGSSKNNIKR